MKLPPRLQSVVELLRDGPKTAAELMSAGIATPADAVSRLRGHGCEIVTIKSNDGRAIYSLLEGEK